MPTGGVCRDDESVGGGGRSTFIKGLVMSLALPGVRFHDERILWRGVGSVSSSSSSSIHFPGAMDERGGEEEEKQRERGARGDLWFGCSTPSQMLLGSMPMFPVYL